jgi:hypothetical protein
MSFIAPNLTAIVGSALAAKLMGIAGGLTALSKIPACNIKLLGKDKKTLTGFSSTMIKAHNGAIFNCDLVQQTPPHLRQRALRAVAGKYVCGQGHACTRRSAQRVGWCGPVGARSQHASTAFTSAAMVRRAAPLWCMCVRAGVFTKRTGRAGALGRFTRQKAAGRPGAQD